jgi:hypothetical protein
MKTTPLVSLLSVACSAIALGVPKDAAQLQSYPKNLARQHLGANLFHYKPATRSYAPTEAAAAWLDDDISTGWPVLPEKQYYLLALPSAELMTNFSVSARPAEGTVSLYAGDEPAAPGAKTWTTVAKDVPLDSLNQKKLGKAFSRLAKYLLIETNIADPGSVYSLQVYGEKPAVAYDLLKREQSIDTRAILGPWVSEPTAINVAGLHAQSYVADSTAPGGISAWQRAVDDNPESALTIAPSADKPGAMIPLGSTQSIKRLAVLTDPGASGTLEVSFIGASSAEAADAQPIAIALDGTTARTNVDFPATEASQISVRWIPANGTDAVTLREINAFAEPTLSTYAVAVKPGALIESEGDRLAAVDRSKDGKEYKNPVDGKEAKEAVPPIGEFIPQRGPYLPGALGFPPIVSGRDIPVSN